MTTTKKICAALVTMAFVVAIASPLLVLALHGAVQPYGHKDFTAFPPVQTLASGSKGALDQLATALLERSKLKESAISIRNTFLLRIVHQYDRDYIASGKDGWLYWKGDWFEGQCQKKYDVEMAVSRIGAMLDVAGASGIDMYFTISPDKSALYPEFLDPHFEKFWACKQQSADLLRATIRAKAPRIIDHLDPLLKEKRNSTPHILYGKADTHWTYFGAAIAFRQLLLAIFPEAKNIPPPALTGKLVQFPADLETTMLLVGNGYPESEIDIAAEVIAVSSVRQFDHAQSTVILHDSFYNKVLGLTYPFRNAVQYVYDTDIPEIRKQILSSDRLIVSRVERAVVDSALTGPLTWYSTLGLSLVERDELAAKQCMDFVPASGEPKLQTMATNGGTYLAIGPDPQMAMTVPVLASGRGAPCVRLKLTLTNPDIFEIFFPPHGDEDEPFVAGRSIQLYLQPGDHEIALVLPGYVAGRTIRIDPGDIGQQTTVRDVQFGWRAASSGAAR